jgi:hypothetical protein
MIRLIQIEETIEEIAMKAILEKRMKDYAELDRQEFIKRESAPATNEQKVKIIRDRLHQEGRALVGEEVLAVKLGLKKFEYKS